MPLNTPALKSALKSAFLANLPAATPTQITQIEALSASIASAIQVYVQGATITYTAGLTNSGGPVVGAFGNIIT